MADGCVLLRSVLDVDGKSFDVILSGTSISWGHVGIEESGLGEKILKCFIACVCCNLKIIIFFSSFIARFSCAD